VKFLVDKFTEQGMDDDDFYFNAVTFEMLEKRKSRQKRWRPSSGRHLKEKMKSNFIGSRSGVLPPAGARVATPKLSK
jgi:hypothetical protein